MVPIYGGQNHMSDMFVMRRADGDLFTKEVNGKVIVPLGSSEDALARYKERNPELMTFRPTRLTRSLINQIGSGLAAKGTTGFLLLAEDDPGADLDDGRPISLEGITLEGVLIPQPAQVQP
jgi:hypothetical protein